MHENKRHEKNEMLTRKCVKITPNEKRIKENRITYIKKRRKKN